MKTIAQRKRRTTLVTLVRRLRRRVGQMFSAEGHGRDRSRPAGAKRRPARWATPTRATRLCLEMGWSPRRPGSGRGRMGSATRSEFHDKGSRRAVNFGYCQQHQVFAPIRNPVPQPLTTD